MALPFAVDKVDVFRMKREEDGSDYDVWRIRVTDRDFILKQCAKSEFQTYSTFLAHSAPFAPELIGFATVKRKRYILIEYIQGENLCKSTRPKLKSALDSLICAQRKFLGATEYVACCISYPKHRKRVLRRRKYLDTPAEKSAYSLFLQVYDAAPHTLCHDDLLPFNIICAADRAVMIDWEACGLLPCYLPLARLIAHGEEDPDALFFMTETDKIFAINYYFEHFIKGLGIGYDDYRHAFDCFLFYEYCEWVYIGNRHHAKDGKYYQRYSIIAQDAAERLLRGERLTLIL